jgi:hypothetical protein
MSTISPLARRKEKCEKFYMTYLIIFPDIVALSEQSLLSSGCCNLQILRGNTYGHLDLLLSGYRYYIENHWGRSLIDRLYVW